jgi:hypothetical protein
MKKKSLSLNPDPDSGDDDHPDTAGSAPGPVGSQRPGGIPIIGAAAVAFGILGIFSMGYIFVPLALICSIITLFLGQISWAFIGLLLTVAGLLTSPVLLGLLGIAWLIP